MVWWCDGAGFTSCAGRPTNLDNIVESSLLRLQEVRLGVVWTFFLSPDIFLYLGDGPIWTDLLSQRAVKPKPTIQKIMNV